MLKNVFVSKMKLYDDNQEDLAVAIGGSASRTNAKINGYEGAEFTLSEVKIIMHRYHLTPEEVVQIFLT